MVNNMTFRIYKDNSEDLGFVLCCLYSDVIDLFEFKLWVEYVIETIAIEDIPLYMFDLLDFNGSSNEFYKIIEFSPGGNLSPNEDKALYGIAFLRGRDVYDSPVSKEEALKLLENNPSVLNWFKKNFPFIRDKNL